MKKAIKAVSCLVLAFVISLSFFGCKKKVEITEESVKETVATVETALREFDVDTLEKYVSSSTLSYILTYAQEHQQFVELGKAIFSNLELDVQSVDVDAKTVTVVASNSKLDNIATKFVTELNSKYSTVQLLQKLSDESFLDSSLKELLTSISSAVATNEVTVTLTVSEGKNNLVLGFDEDAENAVSGGALGAIKKIYG